VSALILLLVAGTNRNHVQSQFEKFVTGMQHVARGRLEIHATFEHIENLQNQAGALFHELTRNRHQAFEMLRQAKEFEAQIQAQQPLAAEHYDEAMQDMQLAEQEEQEAMEWYQREVIERFNETVRAMAGAQLKHMSEVELQESQALLKEATQQEQEAADKLDQTKDALEQAQALREAPVYDTGACSWGKWAAWACDTIGKNPQADMVKEASDIAIEASVDMDAALAEQHEAQVERSKATELYYKAMLDSKASLQMMEDAMELENKAKSDEEELIKYEKEEDQEINAYYQEEKQAKAKDNEIFEWKEQAEDLHRAAQELLDTAKTDNRLLIAKENLIQKDRLFIHDTQEKVVLMTNTAKDHIAGACWYALFAVIAGALLLWHTIRRIIMTFRQETALRWIIREQPHTARDISYTLCHSLLFLLAMGFCGELLQEFIYHHRTGRIEILLFFSIWSALVQASIFHFFPHGLKLALSGDLHLQNFKRLVMQDLIKRGFLLFLLFLLEILLVLVNFGYPAFADAHLLNGMGLWILVLFVSLGHVYYFEFLANLFDGVDFWLETGTVQTMDSTITHSQSPSHQDQAGSHPSDQRDETVANEAYCDSSEMSSLVTTASCIMAEESTSTRRRDMLSIDLEPSSASGSYGSAFPSEENNNETTYTPIASTSLFSWRSELEKLRLVLDVLLTSWSLWIIRSDVYLMKSLSPISGSLVWGALPHWFYLFVFLALVSLCIKSQRPSWRHAENKNEPIADYKWWMILDGSSTYCSSLFR
jgi:chemotaxis protein histidine kinase CheA